MSTDQDRSARRRNSGQTARTAASVKTQALDLIAPAPTEPGHSNHELQDVQEGRVILAGLSASPPIQSTDPIAHSKLQSVSSLTDTNSGDGLAITQDWVSRLAESSRDCAEEFGAPDSASDDSFCSQCSCDGQDPGDDKENFLRIHLAPFAQWTKLRFGTSRCHECNRRSESDEISTTHQHLQPVDGSAESTNGTTAQAESQDPAAPSSSSSSSAGGASSRTSLTGSKRGGHIDGDEDREEDKRAQPPKRPKTRADGGIDSSSEDLACPYLKHRFHKYHTHKACLKGWKNVHRLK